METKFNKYLQPLLNDLSEFVVILDPRLNNRCNENDIYINTALESEDADPVAWWDHRKTSSPNLYKMVLDILSIPVTSRDLIPV